MAISKFTLRRQRYGAAFSEAMERLKTSFNRFRDAGLKLSLSMRELFKQSVTYFGHVVSKRGVGTDPEKVEAIKEWPLPQNLTEDKSFRGCSGYYRRFVKLHYRCSNLLKRNTSLIGIRTARQLVPDLRQR